MFGKVRVIMITSCLAAFLFAGMVPVEAWHDQIPQRCTDSTVLGEGEPARCTLGIPDCEGLCSWPDVHMRVWVDEGLEGSFTPLVTGAVRAEEVVCQAPDHCEGTYEWPIEYGPTVECYGYGPEDGALFKITEVVNAAWAVHMECWVDGY